MPTPESEIPVIQPLLDMIATNGWLVASYLFFVIVAALALTEIGREMLKTLADRLNLLKYIFNWWDRRKAMNAGIDTHLKWIEDEYGTIRLLGIAEERITLNLDAVHVPLRVVEQSIADAQYRRARGDITKRDIAELKQTTSRTPVLMLLSERDLLADALRKQAEQDRPRRRIADSQGDENVPIPTTTTCLLVLGPAGSGKTTTLQYATLCLAAAYRKQAAVMLADKESGLQLYIRKVPLPIYIRLTFFADKLPTKSSDMTFNDRQTYSLFAQSTFLDWLDEYAKDYWNVPKGTLTDAIKRKDIPVLLLLDGLDEAGNEQQRAGIAEMVSDLSQTYSEAYGNRYLVASRPSGYGGLVHLRNFTERHLDVLEPEEAKALITKWFREAERHVAEKGTSRNTSRTPAQEHAGELWGAIERNSRLLEMSENPLLVTSMALLQYNNVRLPDQRARLYEKLVELLLEVWRKQQLHGTLQVIETVSHLARERRNLEYLAFEMQQQLGQVREVSLTQIVAWLSLRMRGEPDEKRQRIQDVFNSLTLHSGLIQERNTLYSFAHLTFQEYLAACALDSLDEEQQSSNVSVTFLLDLSNDERWRETLLLAAGRWSNDQRLPRTRRLLEGLLQQLDHAPTVEKAQLLAQALVDVGAEDEFCDLTQRVIPYLKQFAFAPTQCPNPATRNEAAEMLDRLGGDNRPELDFTKDVYWAERIEPCEFILGDNNGRDDDEKPAIRYRILQPYALARFPVTNRQYQRFLQDLEQQGGAEEANARRPRVGWAGKHYRAGEGNHPVVWIAWSDATAFAAWLDDDLKKQGIIPAGNTIRLATEPEWERAAAYPAHVAADELMTAKRTYPWGNEQPTLSDNAPDTQSNDHDLLQSLLFSSPPSTLMANTEESGIRGTSVVGIFPHGKAACGAEDMAGNVWEWCSTPYMEYNEYPAAEQLPVDSDEKQGSEKSHVLRGGSWRSEQMFLRCVARYDLFSDGGNHGFRLARLFS